MSSELEGVGERLRYVRSKLGYTQRVMADQLDVGEKTYKFYELGHRDVSAPVAVKFCEMFKVDLNWLLRGVDLQTSAEALELAGPSFEAVLDENEEKQCGLNNQKLSNLGRRVLADALVTKEAPRAIAKKYFEVLE